MSVKRGLMGGRKIFSRAAVTARYSFERATGDKAVLGIEIKDDRLFVLKDLVQFHVETHGPFQGRVLDVGYLGSSFRLIGLRVIT